MAAEQSYELEITVRDASGSEAHAYGEYTTTDADTASVAQEAAEALKSRIGKGYREINPDA